jgi:beta-lactam-binding protein with PASTA domain
MTLMSGKKFFGKIFSGYLFLHLLAMVVVVVALCLGVKYGLDIYTHHGEGIEVPNLYGLDYYEMRNRLEDQNLIVEVNDSGYNKLMASGSILSQTPGAGTMVKEGRVIYVTINSASSPAVTIPDIIDNSSFREAQARLTAIGFRLMDPEVIRGERDWVYGVKAGNRNLQAGDKVPVETVLTLVIGSGVTEEDLEDAMLDVPLDGGEVDDFEVVE